MFKKLFMVCLLLLVKALQGQTGDSVVIKKLFTEALTNGKCYSNLDQLCNKIGGRLSGSPEAQKAVEWAQAAMKVLGADTVYLQQCMVPHWVRGEKEVAKIIGSKKQSVPICALGGSIATLPGGVTANVVEVKNFEELAALGKENIKGRIVFYNRPMDQSQVFTFSAYGGAVDQRWKGASEAAKYGAVGAVVRSVGTALDDNPHTGSMAYLDSTNKIPVCAISTNGAELLSRLLKEDAGLKFYFKMSCKTLPDAKSYNVVGELKGGVHPEEIITVGGHLDSWDNGDGAHDDGAGVVHAMETIHLFKTLGIRPKRTIRVVAFMNEENGLRGGKTYAELAKLNKEKHIAAIESDAGGFSPRGFSMEGTDQQKTKVRRWKPLFEPYGVYSFDTPGGGPDIGPLIERGALLMELLPDSQRYFDYHHTAIDTFDKVNKRELQLGAASIAAMVYLISEYGL